MAFQHDWTSWAGGSENRPRNPSQRPHGASSGGCELKGCELDEFKERAAFTAAAIAAATALMGSALALLAAVAAALFKMAGVI